MENTGRIRKSTLPVVQRMLFEDRSNSAIGDLRITAEIDQAHVVMLAERKIIHREQAARLLLAIGKLIAVDFVPLLDRPASRGSYMRYEDYLIETEGASVGGMLQMARSRNDLNATIHKIKLREPWIGLLREGLRLQAVLLRRARRYASIVMPAYTHGQAAAPSSFGHYLAGVAEAINRQLRAVYQAGEDIHRCPLGAGAVAGTNLPIDTERTASLLGFLSTISNSIDAVASRDLALRLLAEAAVLGVTLSRFAADLLTWCSAESGFITLPDTVVGSSSAMPQKRNPFLLEHVQGMATSTLGSFVTAAAAMHAKPFTNSVAVGTEALRSIWGPLQDIKNAIILCRIVVAKAHPNAEAMLCRANAGHITATALANRIALERNIDFRTAHHLVGEFVSEVESSPNSHKTDIVNFLKSRGITGFSNDRLDPISVAEDSCWGGGPAISSVEHSINQTTSEWRKSVQAIHATRAQWILARRLLQSATSEYTKSN